MDDANAVDRAPRRESALASTQSHDGRPSVPSSSLASHAERRPYAITKSRPSMPMTDELTDRASVRVGRVLDEKWRLERLLGVGGMAAVYAAKHRNGARAAVKILHPELSREAEVRTRFLQEGYAANKVEHPGAVRVLDDDVVSGGDDDGAAYIVMELLEGESLLDRARRNAAPLPEPEVLAIAEGVLDVLVAAHAHGIVHRDLKPENLFLVRPSNPPPALGPTDGIVREPPVRVKVLDFGIARIADGGGRTRVGTALGTPSYMAPEQAKGRRDEIDGRTDLFALGATMFRILTGRRVHDADTAPEILAKMATLPAPTVRNIAPEVSVDLAHIIDRALRFKREDRYPDATAMRDDVRAAREGKPLPSRANLSSEAVTGELAVPAGSGFAPGGEPTGFEGARLAFAEPAPTKIERAVREEEPQPEASPPTIVEIPRTITAVQPEKTEIPPTAESHYVEPPVAIAAHMPQAPAKRSSKALVIVALVVGVLLISGVGVYAMRGTEKPAPAAASTADDDKEKEASEKAKTVATSEESDDEGAPAASASGGTPSGASTGTTKPPTKGTSATKPSSSAPVVMLAPTGKPPTTAIATSPGPTTVAPPPPPPPTFTKPGKPPDKGKDKGKGK